MAIGARCHVPRYRDSGTIVHAEGIARLGIPPLLGPFCDGPGLLVPGYIHECSCCVRAGRASSCDEYVDSVAIVGDGVGGRDE